MTRIENTFKALNRPALIPFITAGDPDYKTSLKALKTLPAAGADIIELGMPFSDPVADGETIQKASQRALKSGATITRTLKMVQEFRTENQDTPIVLMGYYNPLMQYGLQAFAKDAATAGTDGLIIVDLPPEEDQALRTALTGKPIDLIRLITPMTDEKRLQTLLKGASGFLYYVSITGVTGAAKPDIKAISPHIEVIKEQTNLPIAIGFGIKTPQDAAIMGQIADGIVVGSEIVKTLETQGVEGIKTLISALSSAL